MDQGLLSTLGRRSAQRICMRCDVGLLDEATGERTLGRMRDLSSSGACIATAEPLAIGKAYRLAFEIGAGEAPIRLHVEVIWSGRAGGAAEGVSSGVRFLDLAGSDFGRLRTFIDQRLWDVQHFLCSMRLFGDFTDLERLVLASVAFDVPLVAGESLAESECEGSLVIVRRGTLVMRETAIGGAFTEPRSVTADRMFGALPVDPRGPVRVSVTAQTEAAVLVIPSDGFWYLWNTHAEMALKLLSCWCLALRDELLAVEPSG